VRVTLDPVNERTTSGIQGESPGHLKWLPCCHIRIDVVVINGIGKVNGRVTDLTHTRDQSAATVVDDPEA
jgi:hypothetical protein